MDGPIASELALLKRHGVWPPVARTDRQELSVLGVGCGRSLAAPIDGLLRDAGFMRATVTMAASLELALGHLAAERPGLVFLGVVAPDLGSLSALVRLQAAAPGVPVVPLPLRAGSPPSRRWTMRPHRALDRHEVVGLMQQLALMDEGARQLFHLAAHDRLTGLANRWLLEERLRHAVSRSRRNGSAGAVLLIQLDDRRSINDRYGQETADRILVHAAARLVRAVRASDMVARWSDDELAVLLEGVRDRAIADEQGRRLVRRLVEPAELPGMLGAVRASFGVALFPDDGEDAAGLLAWAARRRHRATGRAVLWSLFGRD